jgi:hypothetical protein
MPSSRIVEDADFSPDILAFLRLLAQHRVRYLIVRGEAVIYHGYPRVTGDIDFFYENSSTNIRRLFATLREFWAGRIPGISAAQELQETGVIVQFGRPPHRIDLMNQIDGVRFAQAWPSRIRVQLQTPTDLVPAAYIDLLMLLKNKRAATRPKDLEDVRFLSAQLKRRRQQKRKNSR